MYGFSSAERKALTCVFLHFLLNGMPLLFVTEFKYLGHIINNKFTDGDDMKREMRNMFMRSNILLRRDSKCSLSVKLTVFNAYCMCFYWSVAEFFTYYV